MVKLMKLLKKLYKFIKDKTDSLPRLSLCYPKVKIEEESYKPYFIIAFTLNMRGEATSKLYVDNLKAQLKYYKKLFSTDDWALIQYNLGALESLELGGTYQITQIDFENMRIIVRNKSTMQQEIWDLTATITTKRYLNLDKQSILELGIFYQKIKTSNIVQAKIKEEVEKQIMEALYIESLDELKNNKSISNLRLIK